MRGLRFVLAVTLTMALTPVASVHASHRPVSTRDSSIYRAHLPLTGRGEAWITFERYGETSYNCPLVKPQGNVSYCGCLAIEEPSGYGYKETTYEACGPLKVVDYEFDADMNRMRLHYRIRGYFPYTRPATVKLVVEGRGPLRDRGPGMDTNDYDGRLAPTLSTYTSRRAVARGTITAPTYITPKTVLRHSSRDGVLQRRREIAVGQDHYHP